MRIKYCQFWKDFRTEKKIIYILLCINIVQKYVDISYMLLIFPKEINYRKNEVLLMFSATNSLNISLYYKRDWNGFIFLEYFLFLFELYFLTSFYFFLSIEISTWIKVMHNWKYIFFQKSSKVTRFYVYWQMKIFIL